ncbi:hypothetical protein TRFO_34900 [Tritrichomonas foetus]|uniref:Uncharacterized protein n=1 Tax=Tritrichomonas foetus TaxID=1144522 RepID=A0A1J4JHM2_9EUKA|nr:hypothetical protein TRFO_34900 [Tritrichomonas foetus]|eukprot:OHS98648.1 hypothetical protein TRFO_34900 [Tritrichomonas foetus]
MSSSWSKQKKNTTKSPPPQPKKEIENQLKKYLEEMELIAKNQFQDSENMSLHPNDIENIESALVEAKKTSLLDLRKITSNDL